MRQNLLPQKPKIFTVWPFIEKGPTLALAQMIAVSLTEREATGQTTGTDVHRIGTGQPVSPGLDEYFLDSMRWQSHTNLIKSGHTLRVLSRN